MLTIDDGFFSNRHFADTILDSLGIKVLFFIPTEFISCSTSDTQRAFVRERLFPNVNPPSYWNDLHPLNWSDIHQLKTNGHSFGSHTCSHLRLSSISDASTIERELIESKHILQQHIGQEVNSFAFPFGDIGSISQTALRLACQHYNLIFSGIRGSNNSNTHPSAILRQSIDTSLPPLYNLGVLSGIINYRYSNARDTLASFVGS